MVPWHANPAGHATRSNFDLSEERNKNGDDFRFVVFKRGEKTARKTWHFLPFPFFHLDQDSVAEILQAGSASQM